MATSLQRTFLVAVMILVLLAGLIGWALKATASSTSYPYQGASTSSYIALHASPHSNCLPPPYDC
jgi:hypothetical protein